MQTIVNLYSYNTSFCVAVQALINIDETFQCIHFRLIKLVHVETHKWKNSQLGWKGRLVGRIKQFKTFLECYVPAIRNSVAFESELQVSLATNPWTNHFNVKISYLRPRYSTNCTTFTEVPAEVYLLTQ